MAEWIITLVHGTFARGASWCKEDSPLAQTLKSAGKKVRLTTFEWSGLNLNSARVEAGKQLAQHLWNAANSDPGAKQVVIAHSHGGTVALYALRDSALAKQIDTVVTLGTPFISVRARDLSETFSAISFGLVLSSIFLAPAVGLLMLFGLQKKFFAWPDYAIFFIYLGMAVFGSWLFDLGKHAWRNRHLVRLKIGKLQDQMVRPIELPSLPTTLRLFCVSARGDEAGLFLLCARAVGQSIALLATTLASIFLLSLLLIGLMALAASTVRITGGLFLVVAVLTVSLFPLAFFLQVLIAGGILRYTRSVAFGEASGLQGLLLNISFSLIPSKIVPTSHKTYDMKRRLWHVTRPLAHSLTYTNQAVIRDIADFVFGGRSTQSLTERLARRRNRLWASPQPPVVTQPPHRAVPPSPDSDYNLPWTILFGLGVVGVIIQLIYLLSK